MSDVYFNVAEIITSTKLEGPHKRLAVWFQGCNLNCKGCFNEQLIPLKKANIISLNKFLKIITNAKEEHNIEGVTFLGGEPTLQQHLDVLCKNIQKMGLGIILFTGKLYDQLPTSLTKHIDMVIDGHFILKKLDSKRRIIGSTNQKIINVSKRYINDESWFYNYKEDKYEVNIGNKIIINGEAF